MTTKQLYLFFLLALILSSCKKETEPDIQSVKYLENLTIYMVPFKFGEADESSKFKWESISFNSDSTIRKKEYRANYNFDPTKNSLWSEDNSYTNGILKEQIEFTTYRKRKVYNYSNDLLLNIYVYSEDGLLEKYEYEYIGNSKSAYRMQYWWNYFDLPPTIHAYTYDSKNNMVKDSIDYHTLPYGVLKWEYDSNNNMVKESYFSSDTKKTTIQEIRRYTYDNKGRVSQYNFSSFATLYFQKYVYQYLDNGLISNCTVFESTNGIDGVYEQKGILKYEYKYEE
jgi:hypothetical protein